MISVLIGRFDNPKRSGMYQRVISKTSSIFVGEIQIGQRHLSHGDQKIYYNIRTPVSKNSLTSKLASKLKSIFPAM